jgi:catechol 2,3-dioxygenase-like lactoylglutathione lyase family enzyme
MATTLGIEPKSILHFTIGVTDLDRATAFYQEVLGCKLTRQNSKHTMSFMSAGDSYFVLTSTGRHVPPNGPGETAFHHAFIVAPEAYDAALDHLQASGVEVMEAAGMRNNPGKAHTSFPGRHIYFHDPDGNGLEITDCTGPGD